MKRALITGANSGIGKALYKKLINNGYTVYRIGKKNSEIEVDLRDTKTLSKEIKKLLQKSEIDLLINCAGVGVFEPHEEISIQKIEELIDVNLQAPILLCNLLLRSLKKTKGTIVNISSIEATRNSKFSALYSATKAGLRSFSLSLFEEVRKSGVKVININPDITKTEFFDNLKFEPSDNPQTYIDPQNLADEILHIINSPFVITDITVRAQKFAIKKKSGK